MSSTRVFHVSLADALSKGPPPPGSLAVPVFSHGPLWLSFSLRLGKTRRSRIHKTRCTLSPVGQVYFFDGAQRHAVEAGSFLFVPAGQSHRFEDFSSDFVIWVVFYGREGGKPG